MPENTQLGPTLPLFPLQTVLFPGHTLPLRIFEPRYVDLIRDCLRDNRGFGIVPIKAGRETGAAATPYDIGTYATISEWDQGNDGLLHIVVEGSARFRIESTSVSAKQLTLATVHWLPAPRATATHDEFTQLKSLLDKFVAQTPALQNSGLNPANASALAYCWAQFLPLSLALKAELLSCEDDHAQLSLVNAALNQLLQSSRSN